MSRESLQSLAIVAIFVACGLAYHAILNFDSREKFSAASTAREQDSTHSAGSPLTWGQLGGDPNYSALQTTNETKRETK